MQDSISGTTAEISGTVEKITYRNDSNGYTVAEIKAEDEPLTVVGIMPFLSEGDSAVFYGEYTFHASYGRQFRAETALKGKLRRTPRRF